MGALALTHGSNLYFAPGQYNPNTAHGQKLLGHELTHVMQQRAGRVHNPFGSGIAVVHDHAMEAEAEAAAIRLLAHAAHNGTVQLAPAVGVLGGGEPIQKKFGAVVQPGRKRRHILTGALIGSIVPIVGTGIGAAVGYAVYKVKKNNAQQPGVALVQNPQPVIAQTSQEIFAEIAPVAIGHAVGMVRGGSGLREIMNYLAGKRKEVAVRAKAYGENARFGDLREQEDGDREKYEQLMNDESQSLYDRNYSSVRYGTTSTELVSRGEEVYKGEPARVKAHMVHLGQGNINKYFRYENAEGNEVYQSIGKGGTLLTATIKSPDGDMEYIHTNEAYIGALVETASGYHERMKHESNANRIILLGKVVWTLTNAMPYYRGSASVAEWYSEAVNAAYNLGLGQRTGKLDLLAFRTSRRDYSGNFADVWSANYV